MSDFQMKGESSKPQDLLGAESSHTSPLHTRGDASGRRVFDRWQVPSPLPIPREFNPATGAYAVGIDGHYFVRVGVRTAPREAESCQFVALSVSHADGDEHVEHCGFAAPEALIPREALTAHPQPAHPQPAHQQPAHQQPAHQQTGVLLHLRAGDEIRVELLPDPGPALLGAHAAPAPLANAGQAAMPIPAWVRGKMAPMAAAAAAEGPEPPQPLTQPQSQPLPQPRAQPQQSSAPALPLRVSVHLSVELAMRKRKRSADLDEDEDERVAARAKLRAARGRKAAVAAAGGRAGSAGAPTTQPASSDPSRDEDASGSGSATGSATEWSEGFSSDDEARQAARPPPRVRRVARRLDRATFSAPAPAVDEL
jgi:hypothetical protein